LWLVQPTQPCRGYQRGHGGYRGHDADVWQQHFLHHEDRHVNPTQHFWSANFSKKARLRSGGMSTSGSLTTWFRNQPKGEILKEKETGQDAYAAPADLATQSVPGSHGLVALPLLFEGERTPSMIRPPACGRAGSHTPRVIFIVRCSRRWLLGSGTISN
jgi:hypothetical protein